MFVMMFVMDKPLLRLPVRCAFSETRFFGCPARVAAGAGMAPGVLCVLGILCVLCVAPGCSTLRMGPGAAMQAAWPMEGGNALRSNAAPDSVQPPLQLRWKFNAQAGFGSVSPLVLGDAALVATRKGEVHAIDLASGKRIGHDTFGVSIEGTPAWADGLLLVPVAWGGRAVHARDLVRGERLWRAGDVPVSSGLALWGEYVLAGDVEGYVRAWRLEDGEEAWAAQLDDRAGIYSTPAVVGDLLVAANDRGRVAALNPRDGSLVWSAEAGAPVQVAVAAAQERVFVATTRGGVRAFDARTGALQWAYDLPKANPAEDAAGAGFRAAAVSQRYLTGLAAGEQDLVFGASDGTVRSLNMEDGSLNWFAEASDAVSGSPVITAETVYVGTMGAMLKGFDRRDGRLVWETELEGRMKSAFALKESLLIVLAEPRHVYAYEPESGNDETDNETDDG